MATIADLFNSQKKELYNNDIIRIESRGLVNPPRVAALLASSANTIADLVGGQLAGAIGGTANRPSDTIFKGNNPLTSKPITLTAATTALLRDVVEAGTDYTIKQSPSPNSVLNNLNQGGSSTIGVATNLAIQGLNKYGSKNGFKSLKESLKNKSQLETNGSFDSPLYTNKKPFSKFKENDEKKLVNRTNTDTDWDTATARILETESYKDSQAFKNEIEKYPNANQVPVLFKKYGNTSIIPFVGSVSGISEDVSPEWNGFRYLGSPFKIYRYNGVERSLKFNLKLYYHTFKQKDIMIKKINYLKSLAFPYEETSTITYKYSSKSSQIAFSPNLLYVSIGDMYQNVFGYMESLSFSVEENTSWINFEKNLIEKSSNESSLYPSVIDVSIGIKMIENNHKTEKSPLGTTTYKYNFDGRTTENNIIEIKEPSKQSALKSDGLIKAKQPQIIPTSFERPKIILR
jgi:hypothetical protein